MTARDMHNAALRKSVLVVDDEPQVLRAIQDTLEDQFEVFAETSPEVATRLLRELPDLAVILSDQRMPRMSGDQFLAKAQELSQATRLLITGYADLEAVICAVNLGHIFGYVSKPWSPDHLKLVVLKAAEHYQLLRELQAERDLLHNLMDNIPDAIFFKDREHRLIRLNRAHGARLGVARPEDAIGRQDWELLPFDEVVESEAEEKEVFRSGVPSSDRVRRMVAGADEYLWVSTTKAPIKDTLGQVTGLVGITRDITGRKRAEEALQESEERFRAMFEKAAVGITQSDLDGRLTIVNPKFCEITGYTQEEACALTFRALTHPEDAPASIAARARLIAGTGTPYEREVRLIRKDRTQTWVNVTTSLVRTGDGRPMHFITVLHDVSERKRMEQAVREAEVKYRSIFDNTVEGIFETSREGRVITVNDAAARMLGYGSPEEAVASLTDVARQVYVDPDDRQKLLQALEQNGYVRALETRYRRKDGSELWVSLSARMMHDERGDFLLGTMQDITERRTQQRKIERLSRVYAVLSGINALIVRVRDRDELFREACRIAVEAGNFRLGWLGVVDRKAMRVEPMAWHGAGDDYIQLMPLQLSDAVPETYGLAGRAVNERKAMISDDMTHDPRVRLRAEALARGFHALAMLPLIVAGEAIGVLALYAGEIGFFDDDEMKLLLELAGDIAFAMDHIEKQERLDYLAYYDVLTDVANRTLFLERLKQSVHACGQAGGKLALVVCDVERMGTINESLGRQAGDALLKQVAGRLASAVDATEIGRVSADQFGVVLPDVKGKSGVVRAVEKLSLECFGKPFRLNDTELRIAAKAGIARFPNDGTDAETLLKNAEAALMKAKEGGERHAFYTRALTRQTAQRLTLENRLRLALDNEEFVLHYQPKVQLETRRIVGVEALIRWQSPERGLVPPGEFIPLMEETGIILDAGAWALNKAAADHLRWLEQGLAAPRVAVNVSAIQLRRRDFVSSVQEAIKHGATPTGIDLEITESLLMEDIEGNIEKLREVARRGVSIAIDDFGTGYSSLGYLAKLPAQSLKIDRSFIVTMLDEPDTMTLVQTMISLAHSLKLKVVAEGVESEEQAKFLHLLRCDEMQGYLFSRPLPFDAMTALLQTKGPA